MDTSKQIFQLHGVNAAEEPILRKKLRRKEMIKFFEGLPPTQVGIEACASSHHWARLLQSFGHQVRLIPPQLVRPYVKRNKNDAADAEALCEAMSRPTMRFVPVKTAEQQAALMLVGMRERLIRNRTQLSNTIRGYAAEFGLTVSKGLARIEDLLERVGNDKTLPVLARELFALHGREYTQLNAELEQIEARLMAWHRADSCSQRLAQIPWHWSDWRFNAGYESASTRDLSIGAALRSLGRSDAKRSFDWRQIPTRRDQPRRR